MSAGFKFAGLKLLKLTGVALLCLVCLNPANAASTQSQRKAKKPQPPPPLPSGPTGPIQSQVPLDAIAPVPPQVTYQNGELTIVAPNSTLGDILRAVRKLTGAEIEIPDARERVVTHIGPGPAREVMVELLNGSRFNYVLLGSAQDANVLTRVVLVAKAGPDNVGSNNPATAQGPPAINEAAHMGEQPATPEVNDADAPEENVDDTADQTPPEAEQPTTPADQPEVKTPQQMLQEMQQRQLQMQQQLQQQQTPGQPPAPGQVPPARPPQPQ